MAGNKPAALFCFRTNLAIFNIDVIKKAGDGNGGNLWKTEKQTTAHNKAQPSADSYCDGGIGFCRRMYIRSYFDSIMERGGKTVVLFASGTGYGADMGDNLVQGDRL